MSAPAVFISYSREATGPLARSLASALTECEVFLDVEVMRPGDRISDRILTALSAARVLVYLLDPDFFLRPFCRAEWEFAMAQLQCARLAHARTNGIVLCVPAERCDALWQHVPPELRDVNWPTHRHPDAALDLIRQQLHDPAVQPLCQLLVEPELATLLDRARALPALPPRQPDWSSARQFHLPACPAGPFWGREAELRQLELLLSGQTAARAIALSGLTGSGKRRLAQEYLWRCAPTHFDGQIAWLRASDPATWLSEVHAWLTATDPACPPLLELLAKDPLLHRAIRRQLQLQDGAQSLLVLEDVPAATPLWGPEGLLPEHAGSLKLLLIGQQASRPEVRGLTLGSLPAWASCSLLEPLRERAHLTFGELRRLADRLGHWPLALHLLQRGLELGALSSTELRHALTNGEFQHWIAELERRLMLAPQEGYLRGLVESVAVSYQSLTESERQLLGALAWAGDAAIPAELFQALERQGLEVSARVGLRNRAWLQFSHDEEEGRLPALLAELLRSLPATATELPCLERAIADLETRFDLSLSTNVPLHLKLSPHVVALGRRPELPLERRLEHLGHEAYLQQLLRHVPECLALRTEALQLAQDPALQETDLPALYQSEYLNAVYDLAPERLTRQDFLEALATMEQRLGAGHELVIQVRYLFARFLLTRLQAVEEARERYEELLRLFEQQTAPDLNYYCSTLGELGSIARNQARFEQAQSLLQRAYQLSSQHLGSAHASTLGIINELASLEQSLGHYAVAAELGLTVLTARRAASPTHWLTCVSMHNYAETLYLLGERARSAELFAEAVALFAAHPPPNPALPVLTAGHWWRVRGMLGDTSAWLELQALFAKMVQLQGPDHSWTRKLRSYCAQVADELRLPIAPETSAASVIAIELQHADPQPGPLMLAGQVAAWHWLRSARQTTPPELAPIIAQLQTQVPGDHPGLLLLEAQMALLAGSYPTQLGALAATLGTNHPDVQLLVRFVTMDTVRA